jgi:hypothetical protein
MIFRISAAKWYRYNTAKILYNIYLVYKYVCSKGIIRVHSLICTDVFPPELTESNRQEKH